MPHINGKFLSAKMRLGFYYHIPIVSNEGKLYVPGYLGLFLASLAAQTTWLTLFMHEATPEETGAGNLLLEANNIDWVNIGYKKPAWHRALFGKKLLKKIQPAVYQCDMLLIRAPSPLAPAFYSVFGNHSRIAYLIVGDYISSSWHLQLPILRKSAIILMSFYLDFLLKRAARHCCILSNSQEILQHFAPYARTLHLIRTTTLSNADFFERADTCQVTPCQILFVGRYDFAKGLKELIESIAHLIQKGHSITLHLAGWEDQPEQPVTKWIEKRCIELGISNQVINHGKQNHGNNLNTLYRSADIFVMPSYQEGFPRTIWEAMANCLPVIATTVGSIPYTLTHQEHAILIPPKNETAIVRSIEQLIEQPHLRQRLIRAGFQIAKETTLEIQTAKLISCLNAFNARSK